MKNEKEKTLTYGDIATQYRLQNSSKVLIPLPKDFIENSRKCIARYYEEYAELCQAEEPIEALIDEKSDYYKKSQSALKALIDMRIQRLSVMAMNAAYGSDAVPALQCEEEYDEATVFNGMVELLKTLHDTV